LAQFAASIILCFNPASISLAFSLLHSFACMSFDYLLKKIQDKLYKLPEIILCFLASTALDFLRVNKRGRFMGLNLLILPLMRPALLITQLSNTTSHLNSTTCICRVVGV
jgi:hypothetical protein